MILKLLIKIILVILKIIIKLVLLLIPDRLQYDIDNMWQELTILLRMILGTCDQAKNFCYFILGDTFIYVLSALLAYLTFKLIVVPLVNLLTKALIKAD